jgi:peptide/nickel transport system substrate-binding protein
VIIAVTMPSSPRPASSRRLARIAALVIMVLAVLTACTDDAPAPRPSPSDSPTPQRMFTIMTTDTIKTADPAAVADTGSTMLTQNVFQRLMTADPTQRLLKPDAARDCIFESRTSYECTLRPDLKFSNGDPLTSDDVRFSIQRALRLDVPGSSASLLSSLRRVETPNPTTVRFVLSRYDTQFPWALAAPAASIVDSRVYNSDVVQPNDRPIIGSGPFKVISFDKDELDLGKYLDYLGFGQAQVGNAVIKTMPDSASIEEAMTKHETDVVWRGLSNAAQQRLQAQMATSKDQSSKSGFTQVALPNARVEQLIWNPDSKHRDSSDVRAVIAGALQEDRTLDSVVPTDIPGHRASFPLGGQANIKITWGTRIQLTLGYDPTAPNSQDLATQIRTRLEDTGGLSVLLRPNDAGADLQLVDRKAWTSTGIAWLQPIIDNPLKSQQAEIDAALEKARGAGDGSPQLNAALAEMQQYAAQSKIVLPISQGPEYVYAGPGTTVANNAFGPGWQLGLWGMRTQR